MGTMVGQPQYQLGHLYNLSHAMLQWDRCQVSNYGALDIAIHNALWRKKIVERYFTLHYIHYIENF